jgi:hypothetical protein
MKHKSIVLTLAAALVFALPAVSSASALSSTQVSAILGLLRAFSVDAAVITRVENLLGASVGSSSGTTLPSDPPSDPPLPTRVPVIGSPYPSSAIGYDLSFNTKAYPTIPFGFGVVGVTGGKAFVHNPRFVNEYSWAKFGALAGPTIYMNINAPYGSTVAGHVSSPHTCSTTASETGAEPTACEGYNYGYNAAMDSYAYAQTAQGSPTFWWLDIEEANSWSPDTAVNDQVIQGALDYLNSKGIKVGIYSVPYMWKAIAGEGFTPTERINGTSFSVPTWFPIGIDTQVEATNACITKTSFIPGSPIWMLQFEENSTAIDQNVAC